MSSPSASASPAPAVPFFRKPPKSRPASSRTKQRSPSPSRSTGASLTTTTTTTVIVPSKKSAANPLIQGMKRALPRDRSSIDVHYSSGTAALPEDFHLSDEEEADKPVKRARLNPAEEDDLLLPDDGLYHGTAAYRSHIKKTQEIPKAMRAGPVRAPPGTIRTVTVVDYQPDVCKDYKETGYCGFGDTCKFLHDRGTYLAGWQLDALAEKQARAPQGAGGDASSSEEEDIPFACLLCRKPYTDPIVTKCGHYFCSACAIKRFTKTPKCAACGAPTGGMFNGAGKKVEAMRRRMEKKARKAEGEEDGEAPDGESGTGGGLRVEGLGSDDEE